MAVNRPFDKAFGGALVSKRPAALARARGIGQKATLANTKLGAMADSDLVVRYRKQLQDSFAPLIPRDKPIALVGYPDGANCGDHAIWLGEKTLLGGFGLSPAYECSAQNYDKESMRAALKDGTILMHGGGSFGDRHTAYHEFRLTVLDDFPSNKVIVFLQDVFL